MIVGKYLFKNIISKPFRTLLLVVCMGCCSLVAMLSLDIMGNMKFLLKDMLSQMVGTSDIIVSDVVDIEEPIKIHTKCEEVIVKEMEGGSISYAEGVCAYYHKNPFTIVSTDYEKATHMRLMTEDLVLKKDEAAITELMQKKLGYQLGDSITLYDDCEMPHEYKITKVLPTIGLANGRISVFVSDEGMKILSANAKQNTIYVDVIDDNETSQAKKELEEAYFTSSVEVLMDSDENKQAMQEFGTMFFMVFLVCFLLVIFVSVSISNRIVCERMAIVGTFRSLGLSSTLTTKILLLECALYGLIGGGAGVGIYLLIRQNLYDGMLTINVAGDVKMSITMNPVSAVSVFLVLLIAVLTMICCPLKEILRTSETAIRDLIFDNKDTAYQMSKFTKVSGIVTSLAAIITFFIRTNVIAQIICFTSIIVSVALLFPYLLRIVTGMLARIFDKWNMPVAHLAAFESRSRKSTVGSSVLCVTSATIAIVIYILVSTMGSIYDLHPYDCDMHVCISGKQDSSYFSYIKELDGVEETEILYSYETKMKLNHEKRDVTIFGLNEGGFTLFQGIQNCPKKLDKNSFAMDQGLAKKMGIQIGDAVQVTFDANSYMPITKTLTLVSTPDCYDYNTTGDVVILSKDLYIDMYHDRPGEILVKCENPQDIVTKVQHYSGSMVSKAETIEEYQQIWQQNEKKTHGMLTAIIVFGVGLTVIGMISNQLIGFEGRKRECAVLATTSMTKGKLSIMFLLESMMTYGISLLVALPSGMLAFVPFNRILIILATQTQVVFNMKLYLIFLLRLWVVFTLVAVFPIRALHKMQLAEQLKYE